MYIYVLHRSSRDFKPKMYGTLLMTMVWFSILRTPRTLQVSYRRQFEPKICQEKVWFHIFISNTTLLSCNQFLYKHSKKKLVPTGPTDLSLKCSSKKSSKCPCFVGDSPLTQLVSQDEDHSPTAEAPPKAPGGLRSKGGIQVRLPHSGDNHSLDNDMCLNVNIIYIYIFFFYLFI